MALSAGQHANMDVAMGQHDTTCVMTAPSASNAAYATMHARYQQHTCPAVMPGIPKGE